jgi:hypothetical protein
MAFWLMSGQLASGQLAGTTGHRTSPRGHAPCVRRSWCRTSKPFLFFWFFCEELSRWGMRQERRWLQSV